jgi:hypothetical protein
MIHKYFIRSTTTTVPPLVKHGPPPQQLCFVRQSCFLENLPYKMVIAWWNKVVGAGMQWPMFYQLCRLFSIILLIILLLICIAVYVLFWLCLSVVAATGNTECDMCALLRTMEIAIQRLQRALSILMTGDDGTPPPPPQPILSSDPALADAAVNQIIGMSPKSLHWKHHVTYNLFWNTSEIGRKNRIQGATYQASLRDMHFCSQMDVLLPS